MKETRLISVPNSIKKIKLNKNFSFQNQCEGFSADNKSIFCWHCTDSYRTLQDGPVAWNRDKGVSLIPESKPTCSECDKALTAGCVSYNGKRMHYSCFRCSECKMLAGMNVQKRVFINDTSKKILCRKCYHQFLDSMRQRKCGSCEIILSTADDQMSTRFTIIQGRNWMSQV